MKRKEILKRVKAAKSKHKKVTLYLDADLYAKFQKCCSDQAASRVIGMLMHEFIYGGGDI